MTGADAFSSKRHHIMPARLLTGSLYHFCMNILLVNPGDSTYRYDGSAFKRSLNYYALTLPTLAALVPAQLNASIRIVDEGVEPLKGLEDADLVGITAVTASAPRAYEIAAQARALGKTVVLGGPHVTLMPDEAEQHADAIVTGFAEKSWPRLLDDFTQSRLKQRYAQADEAIDLSDLPLPRRDLLHLDRYLSAPVVLASRGCPNACSFCAIPLLWGRSFHHRPVPSVIAEIRALHTKTVLFIDPSLAEDTAYARELMEAIVPLKIRWAGLTTIKLALDDSLLDLAQRSGCLGLLIGFETLSETSLKSINKRASSAKRYLQAIHAMHDRNIRVLGTFVFGLDDDDDEVFRRTVDFVDEARMDLVRYSVFTPFPGTPIFKALEQEERILTRDWSRYNTENVVFHPKRMSPEQLTEGLKQAWAQTYSLSSIVKRAGLSRPDRLFALAANFGFRFYGQRVVGKLGDKPKDW